jgi:two-component system sensor histidine kinase UhpB
LGSWISRLYPEDHARVFQALEDHLYRRVPYNTTYRMVTRSGAVHWFAACGQAVWHDDGRPIRMSGSFQDITAHKLAEERLQQEQEFLKRLLKAHERDRQLTAYDIHDGFVQDTIGAKMLLEACIAQQDFNQANFGKALDSLSRAIAEGRRMISGLRPPILDEMGIVSAIEYLIAERFHHGPLAVAFHHDIKFRRLDSLLEATLYRVTQESLTNVQRHSQATRAAVSLVQVDDRIRLEVRDWGCGFDPSQVRGERFGLHGIRKRVAVLGGEAEIASAPRQGTCITIELSITGAESED